MRCCIVNLATGRYLGGQARLSEALKKFDPGSHKYFWDYLPGEIPSHQDKPYAFKAYLLKRAWELGMEALLWMDAAVLPIRSLEPLWEKIEKDGYWIPLNGWTNYEWTADSAYEDLFPGMPIEEAREINKKIPHCCATAFGMRVDQGVGASFLNEYYRLAHTNAFCGPWSNLNNPNRWNYHESMMGECGPPDVLGHRHDQTAISVIAWRLQMKLTPCPEFFAYPPAAENTIILAVGA